MEITSKDEARQFIEKYDLFLFDCDGVLWCGNELTPYVRETLELLRAHGKRFLFVTNNSTKSRAQYTEKFAKLGLQVEKSEIFGSAYSAAVYLRDVLRLPPNKKVLVVGERGIEEELDEAGIPHVGGTDPRLQGEYNDEMLQYVSRDKSIGAVVVGLDLHINYAKLAHAQAQLSDKSTAFLATNIDSTFPTPNRLAPGAGTIVQAVATCAGRQPDASLGKPSDSMMKCIKAAVDLDPARTCMVGDRLNTDMEFGLRGGLGTAFVLSGVDNREALKASGTKVSFVLEYIGRLHELLGA